LALTATISAQIAGCLMVRGLTTSGARVLLHRAVASRPSHIYASTLHRRDRSWHTRRRRRGSGLLTGRLIPMLAATAIALAVAVERIVA
jgi:hypothetical protein